METKRIGRKPLPEKIEDLETKLDKLTLLVEDLLTRRSLAEPTPEQTEEIENKRNDKLAEVLEKLLNKKK